MAFCWGCWSSKRVKYSSNLSGGFQSVRRGWEAGIIAWSILSLVYDHSMDKVPHSLFRSISEEVQEKDVRSPKLYPQGCDLSRAS